MTADEYRYLRPPLTVLNWLDKAIDKAGDKTPADILEYRERWRRINAGEETPELDELAKTR